MRYLKINLNILTYPIDSIDIVYIQMVCLINSSVVQVRYSFKRNYGDHGSSFINLYFFLGSLWLI